MLVVVVISLIVVGTGVVEVVDVVVAVVVVGVVVGIGVVVEVFGTTVAVFSKNSSLSGGTVVKIGAKTRCGCRLGRWARLGLGETRSASSFGGLSTP